jgi:hypothetical protein
MNNLKIVTTELPSGQAVSTGKRLTLAQFAEAKGLEKKDVRKSGEFVAYLKSFNALGAVLIEQARSEGLEFSSMKQRRSVEGELVSLTVSYSKAPEKPALDPISKKLAKVSIEDLKKELAKRGAENI